MNRLPPRWRPGFAWAIALCASSAIGGAFGAATVGLIGGSRSGPPNSPPVLAPSSIGSETSLGSRLTASVDAHDVGHEPWRRGCGNGGRSTVPISPLGDAAVHEPVRQVTETLAAVARTAGALEVELGALPLAVAELGSEAGATLHSLATALQAAHGALAEWHLLRTRPGAAIAGIEELFRLADGASRAADAAEILLRAPLPNGNDAAFADTMGRLVGEAARGMASGLVAAHRP